MAQQRSGRSQSALIREAIDGFLEKNQPEDRLARLQQGRASGQLIRVHWMGRSCVTSSTALFLKAPDGLRGNGGVGDRHRCPDRQSPRSAAAGLDAFVSAFTVLSLGKDAAVQAGLLPAEATASASAFLQLSLPPWAPNPLAGREMRDHHPFAVDLGTIPDLPGAHSTVLCQQLQSFDWRAGGARPHPIGRLHESQLEEVMAIVGRILGFVV